MKDVADFIMRRNDYDFNFNNLWISTGASEKKLKCLWDYWLKDQMTESFYYFLGILSTI